MKRRSLLCGAAAVVPCMPLLAAGARAPARVTVRMAVDEDPFVLWLAESLGHFEREGIAVERVEVEKYAAAGYLVQEPLVKGQIDFAYYWFQHAVFGARHELPVQAVMMFNDAPGMSVMVANRAKDRIRGAADFRGCNVAEGAGYGTKSLLTNLIARRAGLPQRSYNAVMKGQQGRLQAVVQGLREGSVDVMTFQEPVTSALMDTGLASMLFDLTDAASTARVLGSPWPSQALLASPAFTRSRPDVVQRVVNALVRTMQFVNRNDAEAIAGKLPAKYFEGKDRSAEMAVLRKTLGSYARGGYGIDAHAARLVVDAIQWFGFDDSAEGRWRAGGGSVKDPRQLYTNAFVERAVRLTA